MSVERESIQKLKVQKLVNKYIGFFTKIWQPKKVFPEMLHCENYLLGCYSHRGGEIFYWIMIWPMTQSSLQIQLHEVQKNILLH